MIWSYYMIIGRYREAEKEAGKAVGLEPGNTEYKEHLDSILRETQQQKA